MGSRTASPILRTASAHRDHRPCSYEAHLYVLLVPHEFRRALTRWFHRLPTHHKSRGLGAEPRHCTHACHVHKVRQALASSVSLNRACCSGDWPTPFRSDKGTCDTGGSPRRACKITRTGKGKRGGPNTSVGCVPERTVLGRSSRPSHIRGTARHANVLPFAHACVTFSGTILKGTENVRAHSPPCRADRCR